MESLGRLTGGVAHDFNNILNSIIAYCDLSMIELQKDSPMYNKFNSIEESCYDAANLTKQLLAFSRKQALKREFANINDIIRSMHLMISSILTKRVEFNLNLSEQFNPVKVDKTQIGQVIMNLVVNAKDAMNDQVQQLTIKTKNANFDEAFVKANPWAKTGNYILLSVADTGTGITEEIKDKIFEPFFTTKEEGKGTGLGLASVFGIVKQHGGHLSLESELGKGTEFKIYLPIAESDEKALAIEEAFILKKGTETILVVDDDPISCNLFKSTLEHYGYNVLVANTGEEALQVADNTEDTIHLLITDFAMPGMDGWELYGKLMERRPEIKTIFVSAFPKNSDIIENTIIKNKLLLIKKSYKSNDLLNMAQKVLDKGATP
jgi:CheY-like chemotaxis protein